MIKLKHEDTITFDFFSRYNGVLPAVYRVFSAISAALDVGADPSIVHDGITLDRITAPDTRALVVHDGDQVIIEGKYFRITLLGEDATLKRI